MSKRQEIVEALSRLAFARELLEDNLRLAKVLASGAWTVRQMRDIDEVYARGELEGADGIGKNVLAVATAVFEGQAVPGLVELEARIPAGLVEVRKVRGLGAKKIKLLWEELGITSLAELEYACNENRLVQIKGFGEKTQTKVLDGIREVKKYAGRRRLDHMMTLGQAVLAELEKIESVDARIVGEVRAGTETVRALEVLVVGRAGEEVREALATAGTLEAFEASEDSATGATRFDTRLDGAEVVVHVIESGAHVGVVESWLTGSAEHFERLVQRAKDKSMALSGRGLMRGDEVVETPDEAALYAALELALMPPERRQAEVPLVPLGQSLPRLVTRADLRGALHNHTVASDGANTMEEMRDAAQALGLTYLGVTEHSQTASYAGGLPPEELAKELAKAHKVNAKAGAESCRILYGVESDILADGSLDYVDEALDALDLVIASVHQRGSQDEATMTARMVRAAENPRTDIIGHPTGRLLLGRAPAPVDMGALLDACVRSGCAVELNANPARLDLNETHLAMAKERGVPVSIAADAHSTKALEHLEYGVIIARRAGLGPDDVLNCLSFDELRSWLAERPRGSAGE